MKRKKMLTMIGIAGALALSLSGCSLLGIGGDTIENRNIEESHEAKIETSIAEESKEAVFETENSKAEAEKQVAQGNSSKANESADGDTILPETESSAGYDTHTLALHLEEAQAEADRIAQEEQARAEEYNRQQEEYQRQLLEKQEEYNRQIEAQREENKKKIEQYNAEVEAYNKRINNYYYNPDNHIELINDVNINPGYIIYDSNGDLYATCFISNGKNSAVYDILVDYIELYDTSGNLIARDDNVRIGNGGAIGGHSYNTWTFVFSGDKVKQSSADLTKTIGCKFGVGYRF